MALRIVASVVRSKTELAGHHPMTRSILKELALFQGAGDRTTQGLLTIFVRYNRGLTPMQVWNVIDHFDSDCPSGDYVHLGPGIEAAQRARL